MLWVLSIYILIVFILIIVFLMIISHQKEEKEKALIKQHPHEIEQAGSEAGINETVTQTGSQTVNDNIDNEEIAVTGDTANFEEPTDEYSEYQE